MYVRRQFRRFLRLMQRDAAEYYLFVTLLSFAASVTLTRLFLSLSGYPQIGSGELHIAHVLWGGLLLYAAALLPMLFANRGVYTTGALLAGIGVGLFIDEVGKFITQRNDYFFPVAAPIIYIFFLLTLVLLLHIRNAARAQARFELARALEDIWEALHHPLAPKQGAHLRTRLEAAASSAPSERHADLARALLKFMEAEAPPAPSPQEDLRKRPGPVAGTLARLFSDNRLRLLLVVGLTAIGVLTLKNPLTFLLAPWLPPDVNAFLAGLYAGRRIEAVTATGWFTIRTGLELIVGVLLLASAGLLAAKRDRQGTALGYVALLVSLTTVDILLFYFEQFSTIITTTIQFLLLLGIIAFRRRAGPA